MVGGGVEVCRLGVELVYLEVSVDLNCVLRLQGFDYIPVVIVPIDDACLARQWLGAAVGEESPVGRSNRGRSVDNAIVRTMRWCGQWR